MSTFLNGWRPSITHCFTKNMFKEQNFFWQEIYTELSYLFVGLHFIIISVWAKIIDATINMRIRNLSVRHSNLSTIDLTWLQWKAPFLIYLCVNFNLQVCFVKFIERCFSIGCHYVKTVRPTELQCSNKWLVFVSG